MSKTGHYVSFRYYLLNQNLHAQDPDCTCRIDFGENQIKDVKGKLFCWSPSFSEMMEEPLWEINKKRRSKFVKPMSSFERHEKPSLSRWLFVKLHRHLGPHLRPHFPHPFSDFSHITKLKNQVLHLNTARLLFNFCALSAFSEIYSSLSIHLGIGLWFELVKSYEVTLLDRSPDPLQCPSSHFLLLRFP